MDRARSQGQARKAQPCDLEAIWQRWQIRMEAERSVDCLSVLPPSADEQGPRLSVKTFWSWSPNSVSRRITSGMLPPYLIKARRDQLMLDSCFLAQDRVSEFAKMAPPLTLKETMRAAGNPSLTEWHEHLVKKGQEKKLLDERLEDNVTRRDQVQAQVQTLEPDVEHFENRQNQELQVCRPSYGVLEFVEIADMTESAISSPSGSTTAALPNSTP